MRYSYPITQEDILAKMQWAEKYIEEYRKSGEYIPIDALFGTEDKRQRLFGECVDFLHAIKEITDDFRRTRDKISFS